MPPRPLEFKDLKADQGYFVMASCVRSGVLDCLGVKCVKDNRGELGFVLLTQPHYNGSNFSRPTFAPEDVGVPKSGKPKRGFSWRVFPATVENGKLLGTIVRKQDKNAYSKLISV